MTGVTCELTTCEEDCKGMPTRAEDCSRDCKAYCTGKGYATLLGSRMTNVSCDSAFRSWGKQQERMCYTVCLYSYYAQLGGCCCADKHEMPCTNCPCQEPCDPGCPPESSCPAK